MAFNQPPVAAVLTAARCCLSQYDNLAIHRIHITIGATDVGDTTIIGTVGERNVANTQQRPVEKQKVYYDIVAPDRFIIAREFLTNTQRTEWDLCVIHLNRELPDIGGSAFEPANISTGTISIMQHHMDGFGIECRNCSQ